MDSYNTSEMDKLRELFDEGLGALILVKKKLVSLARIVFFVVV